MTQIRKLIKKDFIEYANIAGNAFPGFGIQKPEDRKRVAEILWRVQQQDPVVNSYGLFAKGKFLGGIRLFDFTMNFCSGKIPVGGAGLLAVDLIHKKEHVAKKLMEYYIKYYIDKGTCVAALYPFRPDFYVKMGFGYGSKVSRYSFRPGHLPRGQSKKHVQFLTPANINAMAECYNRVAAGTHGMFDRCVYEKMRLKNRPVKMAGYKSGRKIMGYITFEFKRIRDDNPILNDLLIHEMIYENRDVFLELMTFLHGQDDQINRIIWNVQDDYFHYVPFDPRDGSNNIIGEVGSQSNTQGPGILYKVIDVRGLFRQLKNHNFNNQNCRLKLNITDSFTKSNDGGHIVHFIDGKPRVKTGSDFEVEITLDISDFSSMVLGVVPFLKLYEYNLAQISGEKYIDTINRLFLTDTKPVCTTQF